MVPTLVEISKFFCVLVLYDASIATCFTDSGSFGKRSLHINVTILPKVNFWRIHFFFQAKQEILVKEKVDKSVKFVICQTS